MKEVIAKLKIHTPWHRIPLVNNETDFVIWKQKEEELEHQFRDYICGDLCKIGINNKGEIKINFVENQLEKETRNLLAIVIYFISICNGFNCEYEREFIVDGKRILDFITFAKEDESPVKLYKDIKFYEIALEEISDEFGKIIYELYSNKNSEYILSILSNYYSLLVYKDFAGNGEFRFRNIITNLESMISLIKKEDYDEIENKYKEKFLELKKEYGKSITSFCCQRRIPLCKKIKDIFYFVEEKFDLNFKKDLNKESNKIANTRNFISHLFETSKDYLTEDEMSDYISAFQEIFRMMFLNNYGVDADLIKRNFLKNAVIRMRLTPIFDIS